MLTDRRPFFLHHPYRTFSADCSWNPNLNTRPQQPGALRTEAPLHPRRLALQLGVSCQSIAQAFELKGAEAIRRWDKIAALLTHSGKDPNWRAKNLTVET